MAESTDTQPTPDEAPATEPKGAAPKGTARRQAAQKKALTPEGKAETAERVKEASAEGAKARKSGTSTARSTARALARSGEKAAKDAIALFQKVIGDPDIPGAGDVLDFLDQLLTEKIEALNLTEASTTEKPRNIVEALIAVMREVRAVGKDGFNQNGNFNFRGIDGTINALGPALRKVGVLPVPSLRSFDYGEVEVGKNRTKQAHAQVTVAYTFHYSNADGELSTVTAQVPGEAMDSGDKGTAKAMSVAYRIALLQTFAIPTHEPDPDSFSYERSEGLPSLTAEEVVQAAKWAAEHLDLAAAFQTVRDRFAERPKDGVTLANKDGETLTVDEYLDYAEAMTREFRAQKEREQQDADAHGDARDTNADARADAQAPAQETRAADAQPAHGNEASVEETAARARAAHNAQQSPATEPPAQPRAESGPEKYARLIKEEAAWQAEVLGQNLAEYVEPILATPGDLSTLVPAKAPRFLQSQRRAVINALRARGDATAADNLERIGDGFPLLLSHVLDTNEQQQAARA